MLILGEIRVKILLHFSCNYSQIQVLVSIVLQQNLDTDFDAGGKVSTGLTATTIVSQWTWAATLLQSCTVASKVSIHNIQFITE